MPENTPTTVTQTAVCTAFAQVQDGEVAWSRPSNPSGFQGTATVPNLGTQPLGTIMASANTVYLKCEAGDFNVPENATILGVTVSLTLNAANGNVFTDVAVSLSLPAGEGTIFHNPIPGEGCPCHTATPTQWGVEFTGELANGEWGVAVSAASDTLMGNTITLGGATLSVTYSTVED